MRSDRILALDGLRGFSALYVVIFHQLRYIPLGNMFLERLILFGNYSVLLFFLISGFLVFGSIERRAKHDVHWQKNFYWSRFFRILPLWWALLILHGIFFKMSWVAFIVNALMVFGFVSFNSAYMPVLPAWSLFVEEWCYLLAPFVKRFFSDRRDLVLILFGAVILRASWIQLAPQLGVPDQDYYVLKSPMANFSFFFAGIVLALFGHANLSNLSNGFFALGTVAWRRWALDSIAILAFFLPAFQISVSPEIGCGLILVAAVTDSTWINRFMRQRWLCHLGRRCYSIYISQTFVSLCVKPLRAQFGSYFSLSDASLRIWWFPIYLVILVGFAEFTWHVWEKPWQAWGKKWCST